MVNSDCSRDKACSRNKCIDPCVGACGQNAICRVVNHSPICTCISGFSGDPFEQCILESKQFFKKYLKLDDLFPNFHAAVAERPPVYEEPINSCIPSPCGPNSQCQAHNNLAVCSCLPSYIGRSPNCRPECTVNSDCPSSHACINQKCGNPCIGSCGSNAKCTVSSHIPLCTCDNGFTGDPFRGCYEKPQSKIFLSMGENDFKNIEISQFPTYLLMRLLVLVTLAEQMPIVKN